MFSMTTSISSVFIDYFCPLYVEIAQYIKPLYTLTNTFVDFGNQCMEMMGYNYFTLSEISIPDFIKTYNKSNLQRQLKDVNSTEYKYMLFHFKLGCVLFCMILTYNQIGLYVMTNTLSFWYPIYKTIKYSDGSNDAFNMKKNLVYWMTFSLFMYLENTMNYLVYCIPFYTYVKILLLFTFIRSDFLTLIIYNSVLKRLFEGLNYGKNKDMNMEKSNTLLPSDTQKLFEFIYNTTKDSNEDINIEFKKND